jgi:hypothetical protein
MFIYSVSAPNVNKIKYHIASVIKCTGGSGTFSNSAPHQVARHSSRQYSVPHHILAVILLVTHPAALTIIS